MFYGVSWSTTWLYRSIHHHFRPFPNAAALVTKIDVLVKEKWAKPMLGWHFSSSACIFIHSFTDITYFYRRIWLKLRKCEDSVIVVVVARVWVESAPEMIFRTWLKIQLAFPVVFWGSSCCFGNLAWTAPQLHSFYLLCARFFPSDVRGDMVMIFRKAFLDIPPFSTARYAVIKTM